MKDLYKASLCTNFIYFYSLETLIHIKQFPFKYITRYHAVRHFKSFKLC